MSIWKGKGRSPGQRPRRVNKQEPSNDHPRPGQAPGAYSVTLRRAEPGDFVDSGEEFEVPLDLWGLEGVALEAIPAFTVVPYGLLARGTRAQFRELIRVLKNAIL